MLNFYYLEMNKKFFSINGLEKYENLMKQKKYLKYGSLFSLAGFYFLFRKKKIDFFLNLLPIGGILLLSGLEFNKKINFDILNVLIEEEKKNDLSYCQMFNKLYLKI